MRILRLRLEYYIGIKSGMGLNVIELDFTKTNKKKIILSGLNGSGKTTILSALHPFNETFDNRKNIIIDGKEGRKEIDFLSNEGILYNIVHVYTPKKNKSFIKMTNINEGTDPEELNPNGNVTSFIKIIEERFGLTKEHFKLIKVGGTSENFIDLIASKRKEYLSNFIPSVDEYIKAYDNVTSKLLLLNKSIKFISNEVERIGSLDVINKEFNIANQRIKVLARDISSKNSKKMFLEEKLNESSSIETSLKESKIKISELQTKISANQDILEKLDENNKRAFSKRNYDYDQITELKNTVSNNLANHRSNFSENKGKLTVIEDQLQTINDNILKLKAKKKSLIDSSGGDTNEINQLRKLLDNLNEELQECLDLANSKYDEDIDLESLNDPDMVESINEQFASLEHLKVKLGTVIDIISMKRPDESSLGFDLTFKSSPKDINRVLNNLQADLSNIIEAKENDTKELNDLKSTVIEYKSISQHLDKCSHSNCGLVNFIKLNSSSGVKEKNHRIKELISNIAEYEESISDITGNIKNLENMLEYLDLYCGSKNTKSIQSYIDTINDLNEEILADTELMLLPVSSINKIFSLVDTTMLPLLGIYRKVSNLNTKVKRTEDTIKSFSKVELQINAIDASLKDESERLSSMKSSHAELLENYNILEAKINNSNRNELLISNVLDIIHENNIHLELKESIINSLDKFKDDIDRIQGYHTEINDILMSLSDLEAELEEAETSKNKLALSIERVNEYTERLKEIEENKLKLTVLKEALDVKSGIPLVLVGEYLEPIKNKTNELLNISHKGRFLIDFKINDTEFNIPVYKNGLLNGTDIKECSSGEVSLVKVALSLGIINRIIKFSDNRYNIIYLDEVDAQLDYQVKPKFINMVDTQMKSLGCEQCFIITHNECFNAEEAALIILKDSDINIDDEEFMRNKDIIFNVNEI